MIDSQTELPAQDSEPAKTGWAAATHRIQNRLRIPAETKWVQALTGIGLVAGAWLEQLQLYTVPGRLLRGARVAGGDRPLLGRFALHLVVILLAVGVVGSTQISIPQVDFRLPTPTPAPELGTRAVATSPSNRGGGRFISESSGLFQVPVPHTIIPDRDRMEIITYTVQPNDNLWAVAQGFGLQVETLVWANPAVERAPDLLSVGQVLTILPVDGIYYTVEGGDTVEKLAKTYQTTPDKITSFELNALQEPYTLAAGQKLVIPGGRKKVVPSNYYPMTQVGSAPKGAAKGSGRFAWPTRGMLSQRFWSGHPAIDISNRTGTPILAADDGYVLMAGRDTWGYGNQVVIDHGNGYLTRYAHLNTIGVKAGQSVKKNQQIGTMGSTGRSTGPHLHFEVINSGVRRNPLGFLP